MADVMIFKFRPWTWLLRVHSNFPLLRGYSMYWNHAEGTTAKAQGTTAIAVGTMGYFEAWVPFTGLPGCHGLFLGLGTVYFVFWVSWLFWGLGTINWVFWVPWVISRHGYRLLRFLSDTWDIYDSYLQWSTTHSLLQYSLSHSGLSMLGLLQPLRVQIWWLCGIIPSTPI